MMGDKIVAKQTAHELGLPLVPGSPGPVDSLDQVVALGTKIGWPVLIKAVAGGGGRGMKVVDDVDSAAEAFSLARAEAKAAFGNDSVYLEKYLDHPRHIEIQVLGDGMGAGVHLGERDCSLQRRHQKVLEEAPSPALNAEQRGKIGELAAAAVRKLKYRGAGTMEFLFQDGEFYFIEMNTRLQVEHPITEAVTGIDLVREQIRIAAGAALDMTQDDIVIQGHAIECRINAEHPETFVPCPGRITDYHPPGGLGVRVDSGLYTGYIMPPYYDSMVAKLIVNGATRNECLMRLRRSLEEFVIGGIDTTIPLHQRIIGEQAFIDGDYDIHWLEKLVGLKK
jgi:acetyl-CoA carboxylase biotin carboxylase subunit